MGGHLFSCQIRSPRYQAPVDRLVLDEGDLQATWLGQQGPAHSFKVGANGIEHLADPREVEALSHLPMESGIEFVESLQVAALDGGLLVGEILTQVLDGLRR